MRIQMNSWISKNADLLSALEDQVTAFEADECRIIGWKHIVRNHGEISIDNLSDAHESASGDVSYFGDKLRYARSIIIGACKTRSGHNALINFLASHKVSGAFDMRFVKCIGTVIGANDSVDSHTLRVCIAKDWDTGLLVVINAYPVRDKEAR